MALIDPALAVTPCNIGAVPRLLQKIVSSGDALSKADAAVPSLRKELLEQARELVRALETPREIMLDHLWAQPANVMAISFGVQTGLWSTLAETGDRPQKVVDLAKHLGMEEELLQRMMRHIASSGHLEMTGPDEYTPNSFSRSLALPTMSSSYHTCPAILDPIFLAAPAWLKQRGYVVPTDKYDTVYQTAHNTKLHWFEHIASLPPHGQNFNNIMTGYFQGQPTWVDEGVYPVKQRLLEGFETETKDAVLFVDVAGGVGHYTEQFRSTFADAPGRIILQDLPVVIDDIQELHPRIERMKYDFFTEQPVKGARTYYTHWVLHDWPDKDCITIVNRIKEAMKPGYSKFLIHEHVIPSVDQDYVQTALDLIMMTGFGSKERSAAQWSDLLEKKCGLEIINTWTVLNGSESVIECERLT